MSSSEPHQKGTKLQKAECLIHGFVREFQTKFELHVAIAVDIINLLLQYYEMQAHIVIANGSLFMQAGYAGDDAPSSVFPSVVGRPKQDTSKQDLQGKEHLVGDAALSKRGILSLKYPIEQAHMHNTDDVKLLWRHAFESELGCIPEYQGCNVLLTEPPLHPKASRERVTQVMFEEFHVNGFYIAIDAVLAMYASGRTTGIVFSLGDAVGHTVPIYEGYALPHAIMRQDIAGAAVTDSLMRLLLEKGYSFTAAAEREMVRDIKEKLCYVAIDYDAEKEKAKTSDEMELHYQLPDGQVITVGVPERFRAAECIFQPHLIGLSQEGMDRMLYGSIMKCGVDIRYDLYKNIVLAGGSTLFRGFAERLHKEIKAVAPTFIAERVNVVAPPERKYSIWIGGSIMASLSTFESMWITKEDYEEHGPSVVHRKCI